MTARRCLSLPRSLARMLNVACAYLERLLLLQVVWKIMKVLALGHTENGVEAPDVAGD